MGQTLTVDKDKLRGCATSVEGAAGRVQDAAGGQVVPALAAAEVALAGSATAGTLPRVSRALAECAGDMVTAMRGLAEGLETAADRFQTVDVVLGQATYPAGTPRQLL
jgi:hypothetical protein